MSQNAKLQLLSRTLPTKNDGNNKFAVFVSSYIETAYLLLKDFKKKKRLTRVCDWLELYTGSSIDFAFFNLLWSFSLCFLSGSNLKMHFAYVNNYVDISKATASIAEL